jgi:hypothetical protein
MSEVAQPEWPDECTHHDCEHECVVNHHHALGELQKRCVCRYGYVLREDGKSCEEKGKRGME